MSVENFYQVSAHLGHPAHLQPVHLWFEGSEALITKGLVVIPPLSDDEATKLASDMLHFAQHINPTRLSARQLLSLTQRAMKQQPDVSGLDIGQQLNLELCVKQPNPFRKATDHRVGHGIIVACGLLRMAQLVVKLRNLADKPTLKH